MHAQEMISTHPHVRGRTKHALIRCIANVSIALRPARHVPMRAWARRWLRS
jgi:hypothetical protein